MTVSWSTCRRSQADARAVRDQSLRSTTAAWVRAARRAGNAATTLAITSVTSAMAASARIGMSTSGRTPTRSAAARHRTLPDRDPGDETDRRDRRPHRRRLHEDRRVELAAAEAERLQDGEVAPAPLHARDEQVPDRDGAEDRRGTPPSANGMRSTCWSRSTSSGTRGAGCRDSPRWPTPGSRSICAPARADVDARPEAHDRRDARADVVLGSRAARVRRR